MTNKSNAVIDDFPTQFLQLQTRTDQLNSKIDDLTDQVKQLQEDMEKQATILSCIGGLFVAFCDGDKEKTQQAVDKLKLALI
jgi:septal ring factor EnvC (AmiA/AmiB activator)